jgi:hypothetical protein
MNFHVSIDFPTISLVGIILELHVHLQKFVSSLCVSPMHSREKAIVLKYSVVVAIEQTYDS